VWWLRRRAAARVVSDLAPDVAGLQEVRPLQLRYLRRRLVQLRLLEDLEDEQGMLSVLGNA